MDSGDSIGIMRSRSHQLQVLCVAFFCVLSGANAAGPGIVILGHHSDNVVLFDLESGSWTEVLKLPEHSRPRAIAIGEEGELYVGICRHKRNIIKVVPADGAPIVSDLTRGIGKYGPGMMSFNRGSLWVAGDTERVVYQVDPKSGDLTKPPQFKNGANIVALAGAGDCIYVGEYFQKSILKYDLSEEKMEGVRLVEKSPHLNKPIGISIGHNGNLFVVNRLRPTVSEFDSKTGEHIGTFLDISEYGRKDVHGVIYVPEVETYFVASGSMLFALDKEGKLIGVHNSPRLKEAYSIAWVNSDLNTLWKNSLRKRPVAKRAVEVTQSGNPTISLLPSLAVDQDRPGHLKLSGIAKGAFRVMATSDFKMWTRVGVIEGTGDLTSFIDEDAGNYEYRFYRLEFIEADQ